MYDSPIEKIIGEIKSQIVKNEEENLMVQVSQAIGYSIDKYELIKALNYDRHQYEKGYEDGLNSSKWISVSERLPKDGQSVLFCDIDNDIMVGYHAKGRPGTHFTENASFEDVKNVRAWMPLPEPYEAERSETDEAND